MVTDGNHRAPLGNHPGSGGGEAGQPGSFRRQRLHQRSGCILPPAFQLHNGGFQPAAQGIPPAGRRRKAVGQLPPLLTIGALLLVLRILLLGLPGQPVRAIQHHNGIRRHIIRQGMRIKQAVVEGQRLRVGVDQQPRQLLLVAGNRIGPAPRQVNPAAAFRKDGRVAEVRQLLVGGNNLHPVGRLNGTLRFRVKAADGIHLVPPQLNAAGQLGPGRKHIQNAPAQAETARRGHLGLAPVAQLHPGVEQRINGGYPAAGAQLIAIRQVRMPPQRQVRRQRKTQGR